MNEEHRARIEQLDNALALGAIDRDTYEAAVGALRAQLAESGAIAQGRDALAVGAGGVAARDNYGNINTGVTLQQGTRPGAGPQDLRRAYLARILAQANQLPLFAGDSAKAEIRLSSVYTALLTQRSEEDAAPARTMPEREARRLSALDVLNAESKLVLLGGPGSGKTTFVNFVALCMAGDLLGAMAVNLGTLTAPIPPEPGLSDQEPRPQRWDHRALLPVRVVPRDFAAALPAPGAAVNAETL